MSHGVSKSNDNEKRELFWPPLRNRHRKPGPCGLKNNDTPDAETGSRVSRLNTKETLCMMVIIIFNKHSIRSDVIPS